MLRIILFAAILNLLPLFQFSDIFAEENPILPTFYLELDPRHYQALLNDPFADRTFPAIFSTDSESWDCQVRFRGSSSRNLPKKSWRIKFDDDSGPYDREKVYLNADYRDFSQMRNMLALNLHRLAGLPSPRATHANLFVNGTYFGVYLNVEPLDEDFLERYDIEDGQLYKGDNGAHLAPLLFFDDYANVWDLKAGDPDHFQTLHKTFSQIQFFDPADFTNLIQDEFDLDNILSYFAVTFAIANDDGFISNLFIYFNPVSGRIQLYPWDNDASFGNDWRGNYSESFERFNGSDAFQYQLLLQRLLSNPQWRQQFLQKLDWVIHDGFEAVATNIDSAFQVIRPDVLRDPQKKANNLQFEIEYRRIKHFLERRRNFLENFSLRIPSPIEAIVPFNSLPEPGENVAIEVEAAAGRQLFLQYSSDIEFGQWGKNFRRQNLALRDDGRQGDQIAGDGIYSARLNMPAKAGYLAYTIGDDHGGFYRNGWANINFAPAIPNILNVNKSSLYSYQSLQFQNFWEVGDNLIVEVINRSGATLDLGFCRLRGSGPAAQLVIPPGTVLPPGARVLFCRNRALTEWLFCNEQPAEMIVEGLFFDLATGDSLTLAAPDGRQVLSETVLGIANRPELPRANIVINEVNYNSADDFDSEDWIELYNPNTFTVDVSYWQLGDSDPDHRFLLPSGTQIESDGYLVLCRDAAAFDQLHPGVWRIGDIDFGFSGGGEAVGLYDAPGTLVDSLEYDDRSPWPDSADGLGYTLELSHPGSDNSLAANWRASRSIGGTPGRRNSRWESRDISGIVINEIGFSDSSLASGAAWLEIYNNGTESIELQGWSIRDGDGGSFCQFTPGRQLAPGEYLQCFRDGNIARRIYRRLRTAQRQQLAYRLIDASGITIDRIEFDANRLRAIFRGPGQQALELLHPDLDNLLIDNWVLAGGGQGSPGRQNDNYRPYSPPARVEALRFFQGFPNPFNDQITIQYDLEKSGMTTLEIYNVRGQLIKTLVAENQQACRHSISWRPGQLSSGIYFCLLQEAGGRRELQKIVYLK